MPLNFGEIKDQLTQHLEFEDAVDLLDPAMRAREINDAYLQVSAELKLVINTVESNILHNPLTANVLSRPIDFCEFLPDGLYYNGCRLIATTIAEAFDFDPNWNKPNGITGSPMYYIHDNLVALGGINIYPRDVTTTPVDYFLRYSAYPARMVNNTDVPWYDRYRSYNDILAMMAASKILAGGKGNEFLQASQFFRNRAAERTEELRKFINRNRVTATRLYIGNTNPPRGSGGRRIW